ncbi:hypothetical protein BFJ66_g13284 [Fusarium oxysporum f. sp. cepae]|nr:hypothetical protein BFJ66_g13284 [Fusarium oxysporum f. sp. cepae]
MQHSHLFLPSDFFLVGVVDSQVNDTNPSTTVESGGPEPKHTIIYKRRLISQRVHQGLMILYPVQANGERNEPYDPVRYSLVRFVETVQYSLEIMLLNGSKPSRQTHRKCDHFRPARDIVVRWICVSLHTLTAAPLSNPTDHSVAS